MATTVSNQPRSAATALVDAARKAGAGIVAHTQDDGARYDVKVLPLRGGVSMLMGAGGNMAILDGPEGKLLVDSGLVESRSKVREALRKIGDRPVEYVVNTHWHFDHTGGNARTRGEGATLIAHENVGRRLSVATRVEDWAHTFPAQPVAAIPTVVVEGRHTVRFNGTTVTIAYYGPAHTDGDVSVRFEEADILATGDTWWNGWYPFIDYSTGGSIDGMIRAANANLAMVGDKTLVVSGHGPGGDRSNLVEFRDMLVEIRENVATLKKQGRSLEETLEAKPTAAFDSKWQNGAIGRDLFTILVYKGV